MVTESKKIDLFFFFAFQALQTLANVYNGFATLLILVLLLVALPVDLQLTTSVRIRGLFAAISASIAGLGPLLANQFFLLTDTRLKDIYRPTNASNEVLPTISLIAKDRGLYNWIAENSVARPEAGWISTPIVLLLIGLLSYSLFVSKTMSNGTKRFVLVTSVGVFLLSVVIWEIPWFGWLRSIYFYLLSPLRGVSNFSKVVPILLIIICLQLAKDILNTSSNFKFSCKHLSLTTAIFSFVFLLDNVPLQGSYWLLRDVRPLVQTYESPLLTEHQGAVAQFPDFMYGPKWGIPQRFIQLAQMGDKRPRINGRDYLQLQNGTAAMPLPMSDEALSKLLNRGTTTVLLNRRLIPKDDLMNTLSFLRSKNFKEFYLQAGIDEAPIYESLDIVGFNLK
jgi:hypothetical protein